MKYILLFSLNIFSVAASAQDCSKELLAQKPGTWKAGLKGSIVNVSAADLAKEKAVLDKIHNMVNTGYSPKGCQVLYGTTFGKSLATNQSWIADPYYYSMYILRYLCDQQSADKSKYYVDHATPTTVNIIANASYWLNALYAADMGDDFRGYLKLTKRPEKREGFYFMGEEKAYDEPLYEYRWLITYNDTLPFSYLTRKEYLVIQKNRLDKSLKENPSSKVYLDKYYKNISDFLTKSETELEKTAVCMWNDEERFERFVDEGTKGSFIAIKSNLDYYHKKLPKSSPQFFTVVYKISKDGAVFDTNMEAIIKAVDFSTLKNMLGK
ncbi:MAG: hypothetical protein IPO53_03960 [Chitinophagaceae bacterium]|nr:hypothetical protein [Chitinophagaceae bacterium]